MTRGIFCILLVVVIFAPIVRKIYKLNPTTPEMLVEAQQGLVDPVAVLPEPAERMAYVVGCLLALPVLFGVMFALRYVESRSGPISPWLKIAGHVAALVACWAYGRWLFRGNGNLKYEAGLLLGLLYVLYLRGASLVPVSRGGRIALQVGAAVIWIVFVHWALRTNEYFHLVLNLLYQRPIWIAPIVLLSWPVMAWLNRDAWAPRWLARAIVGLALAIVFLASWMGDRNPYTAGHFHFSAAFDPVAEVQLGKDLLVDYDSQYGLYPDLLAPLFAVIGLNVFNYTLVFGLLTAGSFGLMWWVLRQVVARRSVAIIGFAALIFNGWMTFQLHVRGCHPAYFDPYYQYMPIRLIFPACAVALAWAYHARQTATVSGTFMSRVKDASRVESQGCQTPSRRLYWFANVTLAVGVLWNLDGGIVALAAWLCGCLLDALYATDWPAHMRGMARHVIAVMLSLAGVVLTYSLIKYACFGVWPQFARMVEFQRLFYGSGFYMLPMFLRGMWLLVILAYLVGLTQGVSAALAGERSPRTALTFVLSVLGLGLFSYYQGRSHDFCLIICWWPALLLLPIYWDQLLDWHERKETRNPLVFVLASTIGLFLISSAASFVRESPELCKLGVAQCAEAFQPGSPYEDDARLLHERIPRGEEVVALSVAGPVLQLYSHSPSLAPGGLTQMLWMAKYEELLQTMESRERSWVFVDRDFEAQFLPDPKRARGIKLIADTILDRLEKVGESPHGTLYEFHGRDAAKANIAPVHIVAGHSDKRGG